MVLKTRSKGDQSMNNTSQKFSKKYLIVNEVFNAITHGIGIILAIIGFVFLLIKAISMQDAIRIVSYSIYGTTLLLLYFSSTLYHSLKFTRARKIFRIFDHSSIFLVIAGTYTPFCLVALNNWIGWTLCILTWLIAICGVIVKSIQIAWFKESTVLYIIMGWLCVLVIYPLYQSLGLQGVLWLAGGGLSFTVGAIFYKLKTIKFMHPIWHLFVLLGTLCMYFTIIFYV